MARHEYTQRKRALDVIFEAEQKSILVPGLLRELLAERRTVSTHQVPIQDLGADYVNLVADNLYEVDGMIEDFSKWGLRRLSSLDRAVLRLGIAEICFAGTPIQEAVIDYSDIVRELGNEKSIGFITAILNRAKDETNKLREELVSEAADPESVLTEEPIEEADSVVVEEAPLEDDSIQLDGLADSELSTGSEIDEIGPLDPDTVEETER